MFVKKGANQQAVGMSPGILGFVFIFFVLFSCKEKTIVIPDSILAKDTMVAVLVDIQLLEAMKIKEGIKDSLSTDSILFQYSLIFNKQKITQEQFEQSLNFYKSNPELLEEIYDKAISELSRMQAMLGNINIALSDSIKKSREKPIPGKGKDARALKEEIEKKNSKPKIENKKSPSE